MKSNYINNFQRDAEGLGTGGEKPRKSILDMAFDHLKSEGILGDNDTLNVYGPEGEHLKSYPAAALPSGKGEQPQGEGDIETMANKYCDYHYSQGELRKYYSIAYAAYMACGRKQQRDLTAAKERIAELEDEVRKWQEASLADEQSWIDMWARISEKDARIATLEAQRKEDVREAFSEGVKAVVIIASDPLMQKTTSKALADYYSDEATRKLDKKLATYLTRFDSAGENKNTQI